MNEEEKIINLMKENNGMIITKEVTAKNISKVVLARLVRNGIIQRHQRGLYILPNSWKDEYYSLIFNKRGAVFSHLTALYFHNFNELEPLTYDLSVAYNYSGMLAKNKKVTLHYIKPELLDLGRISIESPIGLGQLIDCYDVERCLCDIFKDKIYKKHLKYVFTEYYKNQKHDPFKLYEYAKKLNIEKEIRDYMKIL